jgi:hypothetical protein
MSLRLVASHGLPLEPAPPAPAALTRLVGEVDRVRVQLVEVACRQCGAVTFLVLPDSIGLDVLRCPCCTSRGTCRASRLGD